MKVKVTVESTTGHVKRASVDLFSEKDKSLKLKLYSYYHEDIAVLEKLLAEETA